MTPIRNLRVVESRKTYIPHLLIIALLWSLAMTMEYHDQAEQAREAAAQADKQFVSCLRGEWRAVTEQGVEIGCMPVQMNEPLRKS